MSDILVAIAVSLAGDDWFANEAERMAASLLAGTAGDVRHGGVPGAWLMARSARLSGPRRQSRLKRTAFTPGPDGSYTLFSGRIQERGQLAGLLGGIPPGAGDAELYAAAHARLGARCDSIVLGDYAVIQWFPEQRRLRLARSAMSSHPLHVWRDGHRMVVSSVPRTIFAAGVQAQIDDRKFADSLLLNSQSGSDSWYLGLARVPVATVSQHDAAGRHSRTFWSIADVPDVRFARDQDYVEAVDEQFRRAVRVALEGAERPCVLLSGGLDSQAVASYAMAQMGSERPLPTFTAVPRPGWQPIAHSRAIADESPYVRALAEMYPQMQPTFLDGAERTFGDRLDAMYLLSGWPTYNEMTMHWQHGAQQRAVEQGCDVMLSGEAGNFGFSYHAAAAFPSWFRRGAWRRLIRELRLSDDDRPLWRQVLSRAVWPFAPRYLRLLRDRRNPRRWNPFSTWSPLREDHARQSGALARAIAADADPLFYPPTSSRQWRRNRYQSFHGNNAEITLGMRLLHGIECRDPTAFLPLMELCAGIPDDQYLRNGQSRWLARRMLKGRVPEVVRMETRSGTQSGDWPVWFAKIREDLLREVEGMASDSRLSAILDVRRLAQDLRDPPDIQDPEQFAMLRLNLAIGRGVPYARFVRYVEGRNLG